MSNVQILQSSNNIQHNFQVSGTNLSFFDLEGLKDSLNEQTEAIHTVSVNFANVCPETDKIHQVTKKVPVIISGDSDYQLTSDFIDFLKDLRQSGFTIETLILNDLEIESTVLKEVLKFLKEELTSLRLNRVPLDQAHEDVLNDIQMNLKNVSLLYVLPDNKSIFADQNNSEKKTSIDLNLTNLGPEIRYLELKGIPFSQRLLAEIKELKSLEHLSLENLVGNKSQNLENIKSILADLYRFPKLTTLSLAGNNLSSIDFVKLQEISNQPIFPPTLQKLNLNSTSLNDKRLQRLLKLLKSSEAKLNAMSLSKCSAYLRTINELDEYVKSTQNPDFQYQPPVQSIGTPQNNNVLDELTENNNSEKKIATIRTQEEEIKSEMLQGLINFTKSFEKFIEESRKQEKPSGLAKVAKLTTANQFIPIILKDAAGIKSFLNAVQYNVIDFARDPKSLLPKNDFKLALKYPKIDLDKTTEIGGENSIGEYKIPFVQQVHPERVSDEMFAGESIEVQREKFIGLMEEMGYESTEVELPDGIEDFFKVIIDDSQYIGWDYRIAVFSIIWRPQYHTVSVKFNLSDDCFMERKDRTNVYKVSNQDYLIDILSTLNLKPLDFVGELDVLADGETEVNIRCNIMKYGALNLAKLLLVALDKGFTFLRVLQEKNIFDHEDSSAVEEDARQIRKAVKAELKTYAESEEFLAFSRADNE